MNRKLVAKVRFTEKECLWPGTWYILDCGGRWYSIIWIRAEDGQKVVVKHEESVAYAMQFLADMLMEPRLVLKEIVAATKKGD